MCREVSISGLGQEAMEYFRWASREVGLGIVDGGTTPPRESERSEGVRKSEKKIAMPKVAVKQPRAVLSGGGFLSRKLKRQ